MIEKYIFEINDSPYRPYEHIEVYIVSFRDYYEDAIAIGFSHYKALDYAMKSVDEEKKELAFIYER